MQSNTLPFHALPSHALPFHALPFHALPFHTLPFHALRLISEYSKPLTRPDWRTFTRRITKRKYIKDIDKLDEDDNTYLLYELVHRNMYDYLYSMTKNKLIELIIKQEKIIKRYSFNPFDDMTKHELIYFEINIENIMNKHNIIKSLKKEKKLRLAKKIYIIFKYINNN